MIKIAEVIIKQGKKFLRSGNVKILILLYFLMSSGEAIEAVEAYKADSLNEVAITAFQTTTFANSF